MEFKEREVMLEKAQAFAKEDAYTTLTGLETHCELMIDIYKNLIKNHFGENNHIMKNKLKKIEKARVDVIYSLENISKYPYKITKKAQLFSMLKLKSKLDTRIEELEKELKGQEFRYNKKDFIKSTFNRTEFKAQKESLQKEIKDSNAEIKPLKELREVYADKAVTLYLQAKKEVENIKDNSGMQQ